MSIVCFGHARSHISPRRYAASDPGRRPRSANSVQLVGKLESALSCNVIATSWRGADRGLRVQDEPDPMEIDMLKKNRHKMAAMVSSSTAAHAAGEVHDRYAASYLLRLFDGNRLTLDDVWLATLNVNIQTEYRFRAPWKSARGMFDRRTTASCLPIPLVVWFLSQEPWPRLRHRRDRSACNCQNDAA